MDVLWCLELGALAMMVSAEPIEKIGPKLRDSSPRLASTLCFCFHPGVRMNFRRLSAILWLTVLPWLGFAARRESVQVPLDYVAKKAEERARKPFRSPRLDLPAVLRQNNLDYDKYREIEFRHERALWASDGMPFRTEFFHPGYIYHEPVRVNEFTLTHTQPIRFVQDFSTIES